MFCSKIVFTQHDLRKQMERFNQNHLSNFYIDVFDIVKQA